jgi:NAD(P)-dependent dehydrogenase (short-subunit alcohol dehydrogenase family)
MDRLAGKVVLITGASAGLGRVAAELFAREGARVVVADRDDGSAVVESIGMAGGEASYVATDVADDDSVRSAVEHAVARFGGLHILYNNAGISPADDDGPENTSDDTWQQVLDVNVMGIARCCRHGIPALLSSGGGSIVNVASFVAHMGAANALCPGPVLTPLLAKFLSDDARRQRRLVHIPLGRFGEPIEVAYGALFLASDESSFMTGQSLIIDGGITAAYTTPE